MSWSLAKMSVDSSFLRFLDFSLIFYTVPLLSIVPLTLPSTHRTLPVHRHVSHPLCFLFDAQLCDYLLSNIQIIAVVTFPLHVKHLQPRIDLYQQYGWMNR